jgi:hypothetical protein
MKPVKTPKQYARCKIDPRYRIKRLIVARNSFGMLNTNACTVQPARYPPSLLDIRDCATATAERQNSTIPPAPRVFVLSDCPYGGSVTTASTFGSEGRISRQSPR